MRERWRFVRRLLAVLPAAAVALLVAQPASAATTTAAQVATYGNRAPGSPVFVSFTNTFNPDLFTTVFVVKAESSDGSALAYTWSLEASCGYLTAPAADQPTNGYYHGPAAKEPDGCIPPPGEESLTRVTVDVFRAQDLDPASPTHGPRRGSPYFTYSMTARAQDDASTQGMATNAQLDYNGGGAATTPTPTSTPTQVSATPTATTSTPPWWIAVVILVVVVAVVAWWLYTHRVTTVERPPAEKCAKEKAAVAAAEAALKDAQAKFAPLDAAQQKVQAAQKLNDEKQAESLKQNRAAGAQMGHVSGSNSEGVTIDRTVWSYTNPKLKGAAEKARAEADAAAQALADAQKAFDALGGRSAWYDAHTAVVNAQTALANAEEALARCMGVGVPAAPPTTTDGGGSGTGGTSVTPGGDPPKTEEKPKCKEGEKRTVEVCSGTVTENVVGSLKLVPSSFFESGEGVRDLLNKFRQVDAAIDMASKVKAAFTNPIGSLLDTATATGRQMNKLPPASPSGYVDLMKGALVDGIDDLTHKLDDFHGTITDLMAAWQVNTYTYTGKVTCECKGGQTVVVDRSFSVDFKPPSSVGRRELSSGGSSGMITKDDVERVTGMLLRQLVQQNAAAEQTLVDMQKKVDDAGC